MTMSQCYACQTTTDTGNNPSCILLRFTNFVSIIKDHTMLPGIKQFDLTGKTAIVMAGQKE